MFEEGKKQTLSIDEQIIKCGGHELVSPGFSVDVEMIDEDHFVVYDGEDDEATHFENLVEKLQKYIVYMGRSLQNDSHFNASYPNISYSITYY